MKVGVFLCPFAFAYDASRASQRCVGSPAET
ncbi:MAG: hypothetical protein QOH08_1599, partial [Chloroflexota bacterium]|nr:hypothetical protein [Chloroflexota bacterium]